MTNDLIWHYTTVDKIRLIITSEQINCTVVSIGERGCVWFSANQIWEPTACMHQNPEGEVASMKEIATETEGLARIGVRPHVAPHNWDAFQRLSRADLDVIKKLSLVALMCRAEPMEWFVSFRPVPKSEWVRIEKWCPTKEKWDGMDVHRELSEPA